MDEGARDGNHARVRRIVNLSLAVRLSRVLAYTHTRAGSAVTPDLCVASGEVTRPPPMTLTPVVAAHAFHAPHLRTQAPVHLALASRLSRRLHADAGRRSSHERHAPSF